MGFLDIERITSGSDTQVDAILRENAVLKAINKGTDAAPTQDAVVLGNLPRGIWPILEPYKSDPSFATTGALPPDFIWDSTHASPGEVRYFAVARPMDTADQRAIFILTFSDDAHRLFVEERTITGELVQSMTPPVDGLIDSPLDPTSGPATHPFNWQRIRYWSTSFTPMSDENFLVVSWEVVNYNPVDSINPAGLAFVVNIFDALEPQ